MGLALSAAAVLASATATAQPSAERRASGDVAVPIVLRVGWWHARPLLRDRRFEQAGNSPDTALLGRELGYDTPAVNGVALDVGVLPLRVGGAFFLGASVHVGFGHLGRDLPLGANATVLQARSRFTFQIAGGPGVLWRLGPLAFEADLLLGLHSAEALLGGPQAAARYPCETTVSRYDCTASREPILSGGTFFVLPRLGVSALWPVSARVALTVGVRGALELFPEIAPQVLVLVGFAYGLHVSSGGAPRVATAGR